MKNKKFFKSIVSLAAALAILATASLCGCTFSFIPFGGEVDFSRTMITIEVGESYDLGSIIVSDDKSYSLSVTSGGEFVTLSDETVTGIAAGSAVITAENFLYEATLRVRVVEDEADSLVVASQGALAQTLGSTSEIAFTPEVMGGAKNRSIDWFVNGALYATLSPKESFLFTPEEAGVYSVRASSDGLEFKQDVTVYHPVLSADVEIEGPMFQSEPIEETLFVANVVPDERNPADTLEWLVDGVTVQRGAEKIFTLAPTVGRHTVTLFVNGVYTSEYVVETGGSVTPSKPELVYDNVFPHVYVVHDALECAAVEITSPDGAVKLYSQNEPEYSRLFDGNGFDAGGIIELFAQSGSRGAYKLRVKSLGNGRQYAESEFSPYLVFTQLPAAARKYLEEKYYDRDTYITSADEFVNLFGYKVITRKKTVKPRVEMECYIAYELECSADDLWNDAFQIAATSGRYTDIKVDMKGNVFTASCVVSTVNNPTKQTCSDFDATSYSKQLHALIPHINYDESKYRPQNHVFPIDGLAVTATVRYSDELYFAAENGVRPLPVTGSAAHGLYSTARDILRKICTDEMTDVQKAHAIYDWIMWQVTYDDPVTMLFSDGESYSSYYLEGVFGDGKTKIDGVAYMPFAVCDGMSKAYSLLCNIEGIPCMRVTGTAGKTPNSASGHAWNKVFVNGGWYIVDCTWGDVTSELSFGKASAKYELGLHDWLFVIDAEADDTHFEPFDTGDSAIRYAPPTTTRPLDIYKEYEYNGATINCCVERGETLDRRVVEICFKFAQAYKKRKTLSVPGGVNGGVYSVDYEGIEICAADGVNIDKNAIERSARDAIRSVHPTADVRVFVSDGVILILMKTLF